MGPMLRALHQSVPSEITDRLAEMARQVGGYDVTTFLADFEQSTLFPVPDRGAHVDSSLCVVIGGTLEGQSFVGRRLVSRTSNGLSRVCVPILEGSDCTGVLAFTVAGELDQRYEPLQRTARDAGGSGHRSRCSIHRPFQPRPSAQSNEPSSQYPVEPSPTAPVEDA